MEVPSEIHRLSPSAIDRYRSCPKRFYLTDIERQRLEKPSPVLAQGNAVHEALSLFFRLDPSVRSSEVLCRALRFVWRKHWDTTVLGSDDEITHGREAVRMLRLFFETFDTARQPLATEEWVQAQVDGLELFGRVDRVDSLPDGGLEIIDYKTGRFMWEPEDLPRETACLFYVVAVEECFGRPVERVRIIYLRNGHEVRWSPEREDVEAARERLARMVREIQAETEFAATPGDHCRFCPFALMCAERTRVDLDSLVPADDLPFWEAYAA
jgi:putative RecB family exonuclease